MLRAVASVQPASFGDTTGQSLLTALCRNGRLSSWGLAQCSDHWLRVRRVVVSDHRIRDSVVDRPWLDVAYRGLGLDAAWQLVQCTKRTSILFQVFGAQLDFWTVGRVVKNRAAGHTFHKTSRLDFETLVADAPNIAPNMKSYLAGFSENGRRILDNFRFNEKTFRLCGRRGRR